MARAYSQDLRERVVEAGMSGLSARQAAARFGVGVSTAIASGPPGPRGRVDRTAAGPAQGLKARCSCRLPARVNCRDTAHQPARAAGPPGGGKGVSAGVGTLWRFFAARAITFKKKPPTRPSRTGPTSAPRVRRGLRISSISTRPGWCSLMRPASRQRWPVCAGAVLVASACAHRFPTVIGERRPSWRACACRASARPW